ncbi:MAG: MucR family transcriptional regulator [Methylobacteriaceae bacterium]|nr:MucR family transcriptional regulator [Methylobacteriaceae bacterium]MBV9244722.1 MucR family transcriptional regulator [Methylobacteriaceae bacterium]MBV9635641.1 MucR family transcriptional regulator [Methylobacteriaceae bacterium]MBV9701645.1 MucR family transcriptional regulator [Methylobacteriaceae bacterium]
MADTTTSASQIEMAAEIVAAFVSHNSLPVSDLPALIQSVHASLEKIRTGGPSQPVEEPKVPAVPIKKSVTNDFIICLEDGKKFKSLKRHLSTAYGLSPDEYRAKWGLRPDYPMVAPAYASARSALAKEMGLGQKRKATGRAGRGRGKAAASAA